MKREHEEEGEDFLFRHPPVCQTPSRRRTDGRT